MGNLQKIEQSLQCGRYVNQLDLFWSDVEACWDTSAQICDAVRKSADSRRSSAFIKRFYMANKIRALTSELERNFWDSFFALQQCSPDEQVDACGSECSTEQDDLWTMDTWVMKAATDLSDWLFSSLENEV